LQYILNRSELQARLHTAEFATTSYMLIAVLSRI